MLSEDGGENFIYHALPLHLTNNYACWDSIIKSGQKDTEASIHIYSFVVNSIILLQIKLKVYGKM